MRPLAACGRPTLRNLNAQSEVYVHLEKRAHALRQQLFGYAKGLPGENVWLKPLKGKDMLEYYWPSKYDLPSFHMEQYFEMQALRFAPKKTHPSLLALSRLLGLIKERRQEVKCLLSQLDGELLRENPTLQDLHALYTSLFSDDPLKAKGQEEERWRWTDGLQPETLLALLEKSARSEGRQKQFDRYLQEAQSCRTVSELKETLQRLSEEGLSPFACSSLLFLKTGDSLSLPAPCCSYKATFRGGSKETETQIETERQIDRQRQKETEEENEKETKPDERALARLRLLSFLAEAAQPQQQQQQQQPQVAAAAGERNRERKREKERQKERQEMDAVTLGLLSPPRVYRHLIKLAPEETEQEKAARHQQQQAAQRQLQQLLSSDPAVEAYVHRKHRFIDPLFKRRRLSFLDRLARNRIKSNTEKELGNRVYAQHPDKQISFPDNKGLLTRKWPSPFH